MQVHCRYLIAIAVTASLVPAGCRTLPKDPPRTESHAAAPRNDVRLADLIQRKVNPSALTSTVREIIESGEDIPEFIDQFDELRATVRKIPTRR